mmetsp:Transcript_25421/g.60454  ORF Transcript_25421/g.60454 Transcript_25421/m.60454 type:complete len:236 (+) Transcript_25421:446-1153(+)
MLGPCAAVYHFSPQLVYHFFVVILFPERDLFFGAGCSRLRLRRADPRLRRRCALLHGKQAVLELLPRLRHLLCGRCPRLLDCANAPLFHDSELGLHVDVLLRALQRVLERGVVLRLDPQEERPVGGEGVDEGLKRLPVGIQPHARHPLLRGAARIVVGAGDGVGEPQLLLQEVLEALQKARLTALAALRRGPRTGEPGGGSEGLVGGGGGVSLSLGIASGRRKKRREAEGGCLCG